jgi:hypothetical protein
MPDSPRLVTFFCFFLVNAMTRKFDSSSIDFRARHRQLWAPRYLRMLYWSFSLVFLLKDCFYSNQLKRKEHFDDRDTKVAAASQGIPIPSGSNARPEEYEYGCLVCGACGATVSIRDEETNKFTVKQRDARRLLWYVQISCCLGLRALLSVLCLYLCR